MTRTTTLTLTGCDPVSVHWRTALKAFLNTLSGPRTMRAD